LDIKKQAITIFGRVLLLVLIGGLCLHGIRSPVSAQQESPGDSVFTAPLQFPRIPLGQPDLFPDNRVRYPGAAESDTLLPWKILRPNYTVRGFRRVEAVDSTGTYLVISPMYYDTPVGIPLWVDLDAYYELNLRRNQRELLFRALHTEEEQASTNLQDARGYELVGADIAGQRVALRVAGNVNINARATREDKNLITTNFQSEPQTNIIFNQRQNFSIEGSIGDRINVLVDYNSERDFQFENDVKLNYVGNEDDIIQRVDAGNISLSLPGTQLVTFSPTSSGLFGIRTDMKFGPVDVVTVASIEQGKKQQMSFEGGASEQTYEVYDYQYVKNKYFYIDEYYRNNFYPLDPGTNEHIQPPQDKIIDDIEVFKSIIGTNYETGTQVWGNAFVNPDDTTQLRQYMRRAEFQILEEEADYIIDRDLGFIRLNTNLQDNEILAISYSTEGGDTVGQLVFNPEDSTRVNMKMLRIDNPSPTKPTWDLMFKNVYSLGTINLERDAFEFDIVDTYTNNNDNINDDGTPWLQVFGLDKFNSEGQQTPDQTIDIENIVDLQRGEIFIPYLEPFRSEEEAKAAGQEIREGLYNSQLDTSLSQSEMYEGSYRQNKAMLEESRFKLVASYSNQSANINLPGFNIIEGSEEVRASGKTLQKGTDYNIDYFLGRVTILSEEYLKPGADLEILYETNEVFQLDKKVVMGGRAEYAFGENSFLAATGMYYSKTSVDDKVRVGQEPFRNFVWDVNGRYQQDLNFLTQAIDQMPLISTDARSQFEIAGEVAQVMPNPNLQDSQLDKNGVAYIDDFEGSKRTTSLTISKHSWLPASIPRDPDGRNLGYTEKNRGFLYWYNPYAGIPTKAIWPNREVSIQQQTNTTQVLHVVLDPQRAIGDRQPAAADSVWGGFMRALPSSYRDQSESKYIELWLRGNSGVAHIDLGLISEDGNGNNALDTEDKRRGGIQNGLLDDDEDLGLDGLPDEEEIGVYGPNGQDTLTINSPDAMFQKYGLQPGDPAGDNYAFERQDFRTYRWSNGMQGNGREMGGNIPDTEDLNRNNILDRTESYFSYTVPLDTTNNEYFINETVDPATGRGTGWKQYLIPLNDFDPARSDPDASIEDVQFARIWFTDFMYNNGDEDTISIAEIEIVGNEWLESSVENVIIPGDITQNDSSFSVSVVNNEDNNAIYSPPEGVRGAEDRVYGITSKEQSLVLKLSNLRQWSQGRAVRVLHQSQDLNLVNYQYLKMFLHGDKVNPPGDHLEFFFRLGRDDENYYEYRTQLDPGWQQMELDLDFLAQLKAVDSLAVSSGTPFPERNPRGRIYFYRNTTVFADTTSEGNLELVVHGNPSIGKIKRMEIGARNFTGPDYRAWESHGELDAWPSYTGDIWVNELRVTGVSRSGGIAMRAQASVDFADVMSIRVNTSRVDADFHRVDNQWGDDMNTESVDMNVSLNGNKLFPESWGLRIPVRARYNESQQIPKYLPGSDVLTDQLYETLSQTAAEDTISKIESFSMQRSYGTSLSKTTRSKNWLLKYTVDAVRFSYDVSESYLRNETQKYSRNSKNVIQGGYNVQFLQGNGLGIFQFLDPVPLIGDQLSETRFYYKPTRINVTGLLTENTVDRAYRTGTREPNRSYNQILQRTFTTGYNPFQSLNFSYNKRMDSNVSEFRGSRRWDMIRYQKPGIVTGVNEGYNATYNPQLSNWLKPTFQYQSNYNYQNSVNEEKEGVDVGYNQQTSVNAVIDLKQLQSAGSGRSRPGQQGPQTRPGGRPGEPSNVPPGQPGEDQGTETQQEEDGDGFPDPGELFSAFIQNLQPVNLSFSNSRSGQHRNLVRAPGVQYRLGWIVDPDIPVDSAYIGLAGNRSVNVSQDFAVRTGYNFSRNVSATFNFSVGNSRLFTPNRVTRNVNRDMFLLQFKPEEYELKEEEVKGLPIPSWSIRWGGLEQLSLFEGLARSVSLNHSYQGRYVANFRDGEQLSATYTQNMQPLIGFRMTTMNDISVQISYGTTKRVTAGYNSGLSSLDISNRRNISLSGSYQHRGGLRLPIPFLRSLNMNNNLTTTFTFDYSNSEQLRSLSGGSFEPQGKEYSWQLQPKIDYSFTERVTGGIYYKYGQRFNKRVNSEDKPTTFSDFGLTVNIQIRG